MSVSKKVKALLLEREKKQSDLMEVLGMSSKQSLSNKFSNERWSAEDLVKIAEYCAVSWRLYCQMENGLPFQMLI